MTPTADDFRALARSSPWRWTTLHFTRHMGLGRVEAWVRRPAQGYPDAYDVALDVRTGVVVSLEPVGGGGREEFAFTLEIHGVDEDLDAVFAGHS